MCRSYRVRYKAVQKRGTLESDRYGSRRLSTFYLISDLGQLLEPL